MAGKIIALLATFTMPLFLTRFLTKYEYGIFSQFYLVVNFCTVIFSLGIHSNLYFFYPNASEKERRSLILQTLILLLIFTLFAIGLVNIPLLNTFLIGKGDLLNYIPYISLGILFLLPIYIIEPLYVAKIDNVTSVLYPPAVVLFRLAFVIGFAVCLHNLNAVFLGIIVAGFVAFAFVMFYSLKGIELKSIRSLINLELVKKQLKYSLPFGLTLVLNTLALQFDKIICISFLVPAAYATYSVAFYGIPGVEQVYQSLSQVYLIKMASKFHENKIADISEIYKTLVTKTYSFSIPAILLVSLYAKRIIVLFFTNKYIDAVPLFRTYILSFLVFMLGAGLILRATDKTALSLKVYLLSSLFTLPLTYFLIKHFGIWGGMTSAMVSIILPKVWQIRYEMRLIHTNFFSYFPWKKFLIIALISVITIIPFIFIEYFFEYGNIIMLLLAAIYLLSVSALEIKYGVFIFDSIAINAKIKDLTSKFISIPASRFTKR